MNTTVASFSEKETEVESPSNSLDMHHACDAELRSGPSQVMAPEDLEVYPSG